MARGQPDYTSVTVGFKGPAPNQTEFVDTEELDALNTWETIRTVTTGKTAYISQIIVANRLGSATTVSLGSGSSADVTITAAASGSTPVTLATPLKYSSGTAIQVITSSGTHEQSVTIVGWEE